MSASELAATRVAGWRRLARGVGLGIAGAFALTVLSAAEPRAQLEAPASEETSGLPRAVLDTIRAQSNGREVVAIDREHWDGQLVYEIEFKDRGINPRIYVAENGALLRDPRAGRSLTSRFLGLQIEDTPAPVQQTVKRIAGHREIVDIDQEGTPERPVYRVEMRGPSGTQEIRVDREGKIVRDSRADGGALPARRR